MPSQVDLMNSALCVFAGSRVLSPDDGTAEAMHCGLAWDSARDSVLAAHPWGFATRWARLARLVPARLVPDFSLSGPEQIWQAAPAFGFRHAYKLPDDCVSLIDIRAEADLTTPPERHVLAGAAVRTNAAQALARYVWRHDDCALWPPHFCDAFSLRLAAAIAPYLAQDAGIGMKLREICHQALALAATADARQNHAAPVRELCGYIDERQG